jgi:membrane-associated phospholipid phosphatase
MEIFFVGAWEPARIFEVGKSLWVGSRPRVVLMGPWHFGATAVDRWVAKKVARYTIPAVEWPARVVTWAADEHVLGVVVGGLWLAARAGNKRERCQSDHLVLSVVVTAILPHVMKRLIDQERPDRCMIHGPRRGIPRSGKPYDAFPSGHAMHVGAVASALSWAYPRSAPVAWELAASSLQHGSLFWRTGRRTCSQVWQWGR